MAVIGTGGGKSLLFILPAFAAKENTTIIIIPLLTLKQNII